MSGVENWASIRGRSRLRVVAERCCAVCADKRAMGLLAVAGVAIPIPCWHCSIGKSSIPLFPQNINVQKGAAS